MKNKIQEAFVAALRSKDETAKSAVSSLKAKITVAEKQNKNVHMTDSEIIGVIANEIKTRKDSIEAFNKGNRPELAAKELAEIMVLEQFLPSQMTDSEIEVEVRNIIPTLGGVTGNILVGKTIGAFNKQFKGRADAAKLKSVIENVLQSA